MKHLIGACLAIAIGTTAGWAEEWTTTISGGFDREPLDSELVDGDGRQLELENRLFLDLWRERETELSEGRNLILGFGLRHERYPEKPKGDRLLFNGAAEYRQALTGDRHQIRLRFETTYAGGPWETVYSRARLGATYRVGTAPRQLFSARLRLGYRDQSEENTFSGYDQSEVLADVNYSWQSPDWRWYLLGTLYHEGRQAEREYYSYSENGFRFLARYRIDDETRVAFRVAGFDRDYVDGGREDQRLRATIGLERAWSDTVTISAYGGYIDNASSFSGKRFDGPLFGISLTTRF